MSDHRPQPRPCTTQHLDHNYGCPSQYDPWERSSYPPPPPSRARPPKHRTRIYQEQYLTHHIPAVRQHFAYKPPAGGKAAEFLGVHDVKDLEHDFCVLPHKKKEQTWRMRKFRVTKPNSRKTKIKRTAPVGRAQTGLPPESGVEIPLISHFSFSEDDEKAKKVNRAKKKTGVREEKRSIGCTIL